VEVRVGLFHPFNGFEFSRRRPGEDVASGLGVEGVGEEDFGEGLGEGPAEGLAVGSGDGAAEGEEPAVGRFVFF